MGSPSSIFISYSHDSDAHRASVLAFANRLRADGLDCQIDQYVHGFPAEGWQRWMENAIEQADFVLILCTPLYLRRYRGQDPEGGRGVNFEGVVISQTLYDAYYRNTKFVPVLPESGSVEDVPLPLKGYTAYQLPQDYTKLYWLLSDQHATPAPELGERLVLGKETAAPLPPSPPLPPQGGQGERKGEKMSDTMKAAYIGAVVALLAALIAGLFALLAAPNISTQGDCSGVITGDVNGSVSQNCTQGGK